MQVYIGIPAYNCQETILNVLDRCKKQKADKIIVVNDASTDNTLELINRIGNIIVINHKINMGYGGTQKTIYKKFLEISKNDEDVIVLLHSDGQTKPEDIPLFLKTFKDKKVDVVLGSRMLGNPRRGGMPIWRIFGDKMLTLIQNFCFGLKLSTYASGYRAFRRRALKKIDFSKLHNRHKIDTDIILAFKENRLVMSEIPVATVYAGEKSHANLIKYGIGIILMSIKYKLGFSPFKRPQSPDYYHKLYFNSSGIHRYLNRKRINSLIKLVPKNSSVLDAGCSSGVVASLLKGEVWGVDIDKASIEFAKKKSKGKFVSINFLV